MNLMLRFVALAFIAISACAAWLLIGGYVGKLLPFSKAGEINWWWAISGSAASLVAASVAAPFLVILFQRRRWLAALVVVLPVLVVIDLTNFSMVGAFLALSYFALLMIGIWLSSRVLGSA